MNNCGRRSLIRKPVRAFLLTDCATSKTEHEPQGGEPLSAELDD